MTGQGHLEPYIGCYQGELPQHPPDLERAGLNRGNNKPVFAMWVLNEGGYPVSQCLLQAQQAGLQAADQKQTKKRRAQAARHSRDEEIARQGH